MRAPWSLLALCALLVAGCAYEPYCFNCADGGAGDADAGAVRADVVRLEAATPEVVATDGRACDPTRVADDPRNCGACGNACELPHATPACATGRCAIFDCEVGWVDRNGVVSDGCEYSCLANGPEVCDGRDNDCDGETDEDFDTMTDVRNCGTCGTVCPAANGTPSCVAGTCRLAGCATGFGNLNNDPADGCEYRCPVYPPLPNEICNGLDDNCDGRVDEATALEAPPASLCVTRAATPCAGTVPVCQKRGGATTWYCDYDARVEFDPALPNGITPQETRCDGVDNDCDGTADETFTDLGNACDNGAQGACRDVGVISCDPANNARTRCDLSVAPGPVPGAPRAELCNNVDDDCDGVIDNTTGPGRIVPDMVHVVAGALDFYIDRYESSRPDATALSAGVVGTRACSNAGVLPWTRVSFASAQAACGAAGLRLCTAAEWSAACAGASARSYPYGASYAPLSCNGADFEPSAGLHAVVPTGDARLMSCASPEGVRDLSGNVKEWTNDPQGSTGGASPQTIYVVRGGSFESPELGLTCGTTFSRAAADTTLDGLGFRCCASALP